MGSNEAKTGHGAGQQSQSGESKPKIGSAGEKVGKKRKNSIFAKCLNYKHPVEWSKIDET